MWLLSVFLGLPLLVVKVATEVALFGVSYWVQGRFIFGSQTENDATPLLTSTG
jgi:hypothetical protein